VGGFATGGRDIKQLPSRQSQQNQATPHLKIRYGDSKSGKKYFSEKDKSNREAERRENSDENLSLPLFGRSVPGQTHKHGHEANGIYRDKYRNKGHEKFVDHGFCALSDVPVLATDEAQIHQNSFCGV